MLHGRTFEEATTALQTIIRHVVSCVLRGPPLIVKRRGASLHSDLVIGNDAPYALAGSRDLFLYARMQLRATRASDVAGPWRVDVLAYQYVLLGQGQREILAFHLHPDGPSHVRTPHLHLGAGAGQLRPELAQAHIPTGSLTLAAVVRLAVEAFSVRPLRRDWDAVLARCDAALAGRPGR